MKLCKVLTAAALLAAIACAPGAYAAEIIVTSDAGDTSAGTLRAAAASAADGDVIKFDPSVTTVALEGYLNGRANGWTIDGDLGGGNRVTIEGVPGGYSILMMRGNQLKNLIIDPATSTKNYQVLFYIGGAAQNGVRVDQPAVCENVKFLTNTSITANQMPLYFGGTNDLDPDNQWGEVRFTNCQFEAQGASGVEHGVHVAARRHTIDHLIVENCTFTNFDGMSMWLGDAYPTAAAAGDAEKFNPTAIYQATIRNNVFEGPGALGDGTRAIWIDRMGRDENGDYHEMNWVIEDNEFRKFNYGIRTEHEGINGLHIQGNDFSLDLSEYGGSIVDAYQDFYSVAIALTSNAKNVTIGGSDPADQNIIAHSRWAGIWYGWDVPFNPESAQILGNSFIDCDAYNSEDGTWYGTVEAFYKPYSVYPNIPKEWLDGDGGLPYLANAMAPKPVITNLDTTGVSGGGVNPGATVRLWTSSPRPAEAKGYSAPAGLELETYVAETVADGSGNWSFAQDFSGISDHWVSLLAVNDDTGDYPYQTSALTACPITGEAGDRDMDGLMDWWEEMYGLSTFDAAGADGPNEDYDYDDYTNADEHAVVLSDGLLSDPTDPNSNPGDPDNLQSLPAVSMLAAALGLGAIALAAVRRSKRQG